MTSLLPVLPWPKEQGHVHPPTVALAHVSKELGGNVKTGAEGKSDGCGNGVHTGGEGAERNQLDTRPSE